MEEIKHDSSGVGFQGFKASFSLAAPLWRCGVVDRKDADKFIEVFGFNHTITESVPGLLFEINLHPKLYFRYDIHL